MAFATLYFTFFLYRFKECFNRNSVASTLTGLVPAVLEEGSEKGGGVVRGS